MSPASNNEPPALSHYDSTFGDAPEVAVLCEETLGPSGRPGRLRRDIASGQSVDTSRLIRFVVSPDGVLTPDVAQKLPGRGLWVESNRGALEIAIKRNIFSKAARRQVRASADLVPMVHDLLRRRCLDLLGLARREGGVVNGFEKVLAALKSRKAAWLIEASDGAADGRNKILAVARVAAVPVCGSFSIDEVSAALGQDKVVHAVLLEGRRTQRWTAEMARLSGFSPLVPNAWAGPDHERPDHEGDASP